MPCFVSLAPSNCSNGLAGYQKDDVCCKEVCGDTCGETGCGAVNASNCCATNIRASGVYCEDGVEAPCIIVGEPVCTFFSTGKCTFLVPEIVI